MRNCTVWPEPTSSCKWRNVRKLLGLRGLRGLREHKELKGLSGPRFSQALLKRIRWFEKFSRPRMAGLVEHRLTGMVFGGAVFGLALTAFLSPPFSGLDTLPSLGVVVLSLGVLLGDIVIAGSGLGIGLLGVVVVIGLGKAITKLF